MLSAQAPAFISQCVKKSSCEPRERMSFLGAFVSFGNMLFVCVFDNYISPGLRLNWEIK